MNFDLDSKNDKTTDGVLSFDKLPSFTKEEVEDSRSKMSDLLDRDVKEDNSNDNSDSSSNSGNKESKGFEFEL